MDTCKPKYSKKLVKFFQWFYSIFYFFACIAVGIALHGIFFDKSVVVFAVLLVYITFFLLFSRFIFIPVEVNDTELVTKFFLWTRRIQISQIVYMKRFTYSSFEVLPISPTEYEFVVLKVNNMLLKHIIFTSLRTSDGIGDCIQERVDALKAVDTEERVQGDSGAAA